MFIFWKISTKIYIEGMKNLLAIEQNLANFGIIGALKPTYKLIGEKEIPFNCLIEFAKWI